MTDPTPISDEELNTLEHQAKVGIAAGWVGINPHKVLGMVAELRRLRAAEKELREALTKYPITADGVGIYPGMKVYYHNAVGETEEWTVRSIKYNPLIKADNDDGLILSLIDDDNGGCSARGWQVYASGAAARAALARETEKQNG